MELYVLKNHYGGYLSANGFYLTSHPRFPNGVFFYQTRELAWEALEYFKKSWEGASGQFDDLKPILWTIQECDTLIEITTA